MLAAGFKRSEFSAKTPKTRGGCWDWRADITIFADIEVTKARIPAMVEAGLVIKEYRHNGETIMIRPQESISANERGLHEIINTWGAK